ncbi:hypothetical protein M569_10533 [Genlisea aurea]|uniref:Histone-lysine N-methyltransferase, H3 lysine-9 specific SUVH1 n=1 Tax=Genlisea aurea TaxID=192259 RepID=S8DWC8_9LAMI|nr:hypothetical protein M569_10533 [Genlisea aurea]
MEHYLNSNGSIDKSRVLDVKPVRCLVPVFPSLPGLSSASTPQPTPFVCVSPSGPFPSGVQPFYPFLGANSGAHQTVHDFGVHGNIPAPVPLNSFRTPTNEENGSVGSHKRAPKVKKSRAAVTVGGDSFNESLNEDDQYGSGFSADAVNTTTSGKRRGRPKKSVADIKVGEFDTDSLVNSYLAAFKLHHFDEFRKVNGDKETVSTLLLVFDLMRRHLAQLEEGKEVSVSKRPDLKAGAILMSKGVRTNTGKRIGNVPGIEIGDIFLFRMELCIVGLHAPSMAGIDYMSVKITMDEEPVAVSIVSSGGYDDEGEESDVLIYSGQGGVQKKGATAFDQKLERGNLALEKSLHRGNDVRVIRGVKDPAGTTGKIYIYDGVYKVQQSWAEKSTAGFNVFKYKLVRVPGQPEAFSLWKLIQQWKSGTASMPGLILPDLTSGAESQPVTLVNDVDGEKGPAHFNYTPCLKYVSPFPLPKPSLGCRCLAGCQPGDANCPCNVKNDGLVPYSSIGVLMTNKSLIYECGDSCSCPPTCRGRMSQAGLKVHLEVFKTRNRGWGLRSWDPIRAGGFICEYAGDIVNGGSIRAENDDYVFDSTRFYDGSDPVKAAAPFPLVISSKNAGNVGRFMNHSCSPNVVWKPVVRESNHSAYLHVAFFAARHIPPMQELTYDYGVVEEGGQKGRRRCLCGSDKCRGHF